MNSDKSTLDFGIMCTGLEFEDWQAECIKSLMRLEDTHLRLLIVDDRPTSDSQGERRGDVIREHFSTFTDYKNLAGTKAAVNHGSWYLYNQLLAEEQSATKSTDLSDSIQGTERIYCDVREEGYSEHFYEEDVNEIRNFDLDFILRFAFGIIKGEMLEIPEYGIWSFHHGDERKYRGVPPCFWEVYEDDPVTGAVLQKLTERLDAGVILRRGYFPTVSFSWEENLNQVFYGSAKWPAQIAIDILNGHTDCFEEPPSTTNAPIYRAPSPSQIFRYNVRRVRSMIKQLSRGIGWWNIGVSKEPVDRFINESKSPTVCWYPHTSRTRFMADPFPVEIDGSTYIFFEDYPYKEGKGHISYVEYSDGFQNPTIRTAIEEPYHMSYPYIFQHEGEIYATPETYEANEINLYRIDSPQEWELEKTLITNVRGVDPTLIYYENTWWLFFTKAGDLVNTDLYIWHAPELTGPWKPHDNNPVKTDVRASRPAGTPWVKRGELYRPAQDCTGWYGKRIVINRVTELTPTSFSEEISGDIKPGKTDTLPGGRHTISSQGDITVIDGQRFDWSRHVLKEKFRGVARTLNT